MNMLRLIAIAALAATGSAHAITFQGAVTQGGTVVTNYASSGQVSFDIDFANFAPATVSYLIDAADLNMPVGFDAMLRNFSNSGFDGYTIQLSTGSFGIIGTVTRQFGGSTQITAQAGFANLVFNSPEYLDVEIGDALGTTAGASDWTLVGLQAGDRLNITVSAVPDAATWALWLAGAGVLGIAARRRKP